MALTQESKGGKNEQVQVQVPVKIWVAVMLLSALISASGAAIVVIVNPQLLVNENLDQKTDDDLVEEVQHVPPQEVGGTGGLFGDWLSEIGDGSLSFSPDTPYQASTDGFVSAYTGGANPANGLLIFVAKALPDLSNRASIRTRTGRYDGIICPVPKDHYWKIASDNGGSIAIQWLPVMPSRKMSAVPNPEVQP